MTVLGTSVHVGLPRGGQRLGQNNLYTCSLEARVWASNKERVHGLVRPNHGKMVEAMRQIQSSLFPSQGQKV